MIGSGRILSYGLLLIMLLLCVGGGVGAVLPSIFNWDTDLMFVVLPLVALGIFVAAFVIARQIYRMIITDILKYRKD